MAKQSLWEWSQVRLGATCSSQQTCKPPAAVSWGWCQLDIRDLCLLIAIPACCQTMHAISHRTHCSGSLLVLVLV